MVSLAPMGMGKQIRERRLKLGWTLEKLEDASGVAVGTIHALEQRDSSRSKYLPALAKALGLTVEAMSTGTPVAQEPAAPYSVLSDADRALLSAFHDMDEPDQIELADEIHKRAERTRALVQRALNRMGVTPAPTPAGEAEETYRRAQELSRPKPIESRVKKKG